MTFLCKNYSSKKYHLYTLLFCVCLGWVPVSANDKYCADGILSAPIYWNISRLAKAKAGLEAGDEAYTPAYDDLTKKANAALGKEPYSVTDKQRPGPSGDLKDYVSLSRYFWPNPNTKDGLPYIRKDGHSNPELNGVNYDRLRSQRMTNAVRDLALAAYFSGDQKYADKAMQFVRTWFIDKETAMNPHLKFAQGVPGKQEGREFGILDTRIYWDAIDALLLLQSVGMADEKIVNGARLWFGNYGAWLIASDFGMKAKAKYNNHGTFYDAQLSHVLIFAGRCDLAKKALKSGYERTKKQIQKSGLMPGEINRTKSLYYHSFNAQAFIRIASLAQKFDLDYYTKRKRGSGSVKDTVHFIASYVGRTDEWPYEEISDNIEQSLWSTLKYAELLDDSPEISEALNRLNYKNPKSNLTLLIGP